MSREDVAAFGERIAAHRLEAMGLRVLHRNVRVHSGEIDIIARDRDDLAFVEVRARRAPRGVAAESVGDEKLRRMWRCAMEYCDASGHPPDRVRIDMIAVDIDPATGATQIEHFPALEIPDEV